MKIAIPSSTDDEVDGREVFDASNRGIVSTDGDGLAC